MSPFTVLQKEKTVEDSKKPTKQATVVAINKRELLLRTDSSKILQRNRTHVKKVGEQSRANALPHNEASASTAHSEVNASPSNMAVAFNTQESDSFLKQ